MLVLVAVGTVALVCLISWIVFVVDRRRYRGVSMFRRRGISTRGITAEATILDINEVSWSGSGQVIFHLRDLVLEVRVPEQASYRTVCRHNLVSSEWTDMQAGTIVPVRVDPTARELVRVDMRARALAARNMARAEAEAHAQRQAALLRSDDGK